MHNYTKQGSVSKSLNSRNEHCKNYTATLDLITGKERVTLLKMTDSFKKAQGCTVNLLLHLLKKAMHQNKI